MPAIRQGSGPAGIFTALEMLRKGSGQSILIVERGQAIENRRCPKAKTGRCMNCKPYCHITTGFSGAGAFSDGKLSLSCEVGGDLPTLIGADLLRRNRSIMRTRSIWSSVQTQQVEGIENTGGGKGYSQACHTGRTTLVDCPIRHLGTEKARSFTSPSRSICGATA